MNVEVLDFIVCKTPERIIDLAERNKLFHVASLGVANLLLSNGGEVSRLSSRQRLHYDTCIRPLLEEIPCEGTAAEDCTDLVDPGALLESYTSGRFLCTQCRRLAAQGWPVDQAAADGRTAASGRRHEPAGAMRTEVGARGVGRWRGP